MFRSPIPRPNAHFLHQDSVSKYFESEHYENLDYIQRRKSRSEGEHTASKISENESQTHSPSRPLTDPTTGSQNNKCHSTKRRGTFGLRRPLSPSVTSDDIRGQSISFEEFAEKPFSTVISTSGPMSYADCFPLMMTRSSEAEEKDVTKVQTETRRMSVVSTDYQSGKIHLKGISPSHDVKLNVFPILHASLSSDEEDEEDKNEPAISGENGLEDMPIIPMYKRMSFSSTSNSGLSSGWALARKKMPLFTTKKSQASSKRFGRRPQKVTRRRSVDSNAICSEHFRALQIIRDRMRASAFEEEEEDEEMDESASMTEEDEYHLKHAKSTMLHLDKNLKTLENFLSQIDSSLDKEWSASSMAKDGQIDYSSRQAEEISISSESDDDDATFW